MSLSVIINRYRVPGIYHIPAAAELSIRLVQDYEAMILKEKASHVPKVQDKRRGHQSRTGG
jgi:hypothetical protein